MATLEQWRDSHPELDLPGSREASRRWGFSEATFRRALGRLNQGKTDTGKTEKWQKTRDQIGDEIDLGRWRSGQTISTSKQEAWKRGISSPTLRKAIQSLIQDGRLEPSPRGARIPSRKVFNHGRIALVRVSQALRSYPGQADREIRFHRELELQVLRHELGFEIWEIGPGGELLRDASPISHPEDTGGLVGIVLSTWGGDKNCETALDPFRQAGFPVAVWDERPKEPQSWEIQGIRLFESSYSTPPGSEMVSCLDRYGHKKLAWISPFQGSLWSRQRWEGVSEACRARKIRVLPYTLTAAHHCEFDDGSVDPGEFLHLSKLQGRLPNNTRGTIDDIVHRLGSLLRHDVVASSLAPLFQKALESGASAWICANDDVAFAAWTWLTNQAVKVPETISLVGFDDTLMAQSSGLTSFHFDEGGLATACLSWLLLPPAKRTPTLDPVHVPGFVIPRRSIRMARSPSHLPIDPR